MKPLVRHHGNIENGIVYFYNLKLYEENVKQLEGKEIEVIIQEKHEEPTVDQHGYFRGGIVPTALESEKFGGWSEEEFVDFLKNKFLSRVILKEVGGKKYTIVRLESFTKISKKMMSEFIDKTLNFLAEEGIDVLPPDNYKLNKYRTKKVKNEESK